MRAVKGNVVGTALVRAVEEWSRPRGLADVRLQVFELNEGARAFYQRLGYATLARRLRKPPAGSPTQ